MEEFFLWLMASLNLTFLSELQVDQLIKLNNLSFHSVCLGNSIKEKGS